MKRILSLILTVSLMISLAPAAFAASEEAMAAANELHTLGLFNGTGIDSNGNPSFDLDRVPTRNEAVTMLVRLLGKEDAAKKGSWTIPFMDVPEWVEPYVGYAYTNGLTSGISTTTYGGSQAVTVTQYLTFVLRALGYDSKTDFQWDKAWELSDKIGLTYGQYNEGTSTFTRGDVAVISNVALTLPNKKTTEILMETVQRTPETRIEPENYWTLSGDYAYFAQSDFRRIHRKYDTSTAKYAYVIGCEVCGHFAIITDVYYDIINTYHEVTLHYKRLPWTSTVGDTIVDPINYYKDLASRAYGLMKQEYIERQIDILKGLAIAQEKGVYVSGNVLNS